MPELRFFDFGLDEVRDYLRHAFEVCFLKWGFEGCKLDFWSMAFEQPDSRQTGSNLENMAWFLDTLRSYLPEDGLLVHCIDLPFGSPYRAKWFNQFRYYSDSEGSIANFEMMKEQASWAAILGGLYGVDQLWELNGDGLGTFPHQKVSDPQFRLWCSFLVGSNSFRELAGWLHKADGKRVEILKKIANLAPVLGSLPLERSDIVGLPNPPNRWIRLDGLICFTNWSEVDREFPIDSPMMDLLSNHQFEDWVPVGAMDGRILTPITCHQS
jgi:hypothetical protein